MEKKWKGMLLIGAISIGPCTSWCTELPLVIVTTSYNNEEWVENYFSSIAKQQYSNWTILYVDDNSTDATYQKMMHFTHTYGLQDKITILKNSIRKGHAYNQYNAIHSCKKDQIILIIDGDDWLAHEHVFETINTAYQNPNTWMTYGQFWYLKRNKKGLCKPIPKEVLEKGTIRTLSWRTSHLRTFYAGLFQHIPYEDFFYQGKLIPHCVDVLTMFAMVELAGTHVQFIPDVLYIYNDNNPLSYHHNPAHQRELEAYIRTLPAYAPLKEKPW